MHLDLDGKRALVTASSRGLGKAIATELASHGASVVINGRSAESLREARAAVAADASVDEERILDVPADLREPEAVGRLVDDGVDRLGGLDVLVTNHGGVPGGPLGEQGLEDLDRAYESALRSTVQLVQLALPELANGGGSITHVAAATARESPPNLTLSNVVRPGIYGLSKTVANAYGTDGVRSNCVEPLLIRTERVSEMIEGQAEERGVPIEEVEADFLEDVPIDRFGTPEEFARAVAFLASDEAGFVTGAVLPVDGGWSSGTF